MIVGASTPCPSRILVKALRTENRALSQTQPSRSPGSGLLCARDCNMNRSSVTCWSDIAPSKDRSHVPSQHSRTVALGSRVSAKRQGKASLKVPHGDHASSQFWKTEPIPYAGGEVAYAGEEWSQTLPKGLVLVQKQNYKSITQ